MRRTPLYMVASLVLALVVSLGGAGAAAADPTNLLYNPGVELADSTEAAPMYWSYSAWGAGVTAKGSWSSDAHTGGHSVRLHITQYPTSSSGGDVGDAKWTPTAVPVTGGKYYTFSDWYKSNRSSAVSVEYWTRGQDTATDGTWVNLFSGISPASDWTQYQTGFTMPAGATYATFVHFMYGVGWLETDDYSVTLQADPPGFSSPMVSLTFDDGSAGFYAHAWPLIHARGWKTTQYIPTATLGNDPDMMTPGQISELAQSAQEIGSHSVTHPYLTTISDSQLQAELVNSRATLAAIPGVGTVTSVAYPFGDYDARVITAEKATGYESGRSVEEGYNSRLDTQPFDVRVQNILGPTAATLTTPAGTGTTLADFEAWVDFARAHNYWLVIVFHEVQPDNTPLCSNPPADTDPNPCIGPYDTTVTQFTQMQDYLASVGLQPTTVRDALASAIDQMSPVAGTAKISPAQATTNATLTANVSGFTDPNGGALGYSYQWLVNGTSVANATGPTFDLSQPGHGDRGDRVEVDVKATNGQGYTSTGVSDSVVVADSAPTGGSVSIVPSAPTAGTALTADPGGFADIDRDALSYHYTWSENGTPIAGATGSTLAGTFVLPGTVTVQVVADDGHGGTSAPATASVTVAGTPRPSGGSGPSADHTPPTIAVRSPTARFYRVGQWLVLRFSCNDNSGLAGYTATLARIGGKPATVDSGKKIKLTKTGRYVLRISATDKRGNTATRTVSFQVTADRTGPTIVVLSPRAGGYHLGQLLSVRFSAKDPTGVAGTSATLGLVGRRSVKVTSGGRVRLSKSGRYVLRITARDGVGNSGTKTVHFIVK